MSGCKLQIVSCSLLCAGCSRKAASWRLCVVERLQVGVCMLTGEKI